MVQTFTRNYSIKALYAVLFLAASHYASSQTGGCKDPIATNYNATATYNDGSCTYAPVTYIPPLKGDSLNPLLLETSGLQMAAGYLWSFNDGGGAAAIYRIDTTSKEILQTVALAGANNVDWEDIAFDGTYFYIGDFGNNSNGARTNLKIYKFPLSEIPDHKTAASATIPASKTEVINFTYSDQAQPPVAVAANKTKFDCEAMIVDGGAIHLFTKNWVNLNTTHYVINSTAAGTYVATPVETLETGYLVTAADKSPAADIVTLLGYQATGTAAHFMHLLTDYNAGKFFNGNKRRINLPDALYMGQAEGITFRNMLYGYISNEKFTRTAFGIVVTVNQKLHAFDISSLVPQYSPVTLPLVFSAARGYQKTAGINVEWKVAAGTDIIRFEVEKSADGHSFKKQGSVINGTGGYQSWLDVSPLKGNNYYRVKAINATGEVTYSSIIIVKLSGKAGVSFYPNPASNLLNLQLNDLPRDNYRVYFYNSAGQKVHASTVAHNGGSSTQALGLTNMAKGLYQMVITGSTTFKTALAVELN